MKHYLEVFNTIEIKYKLRVPDSRPLSDFLPTLTIKAKDFATELTSHNPMEKDLKNNNQITTEHVDNDKVISKMLIQRGVKPEDLSASEDAWNVQRRFANEEKKVPRR